MICFECGKSAEFDHHVIPRSKGGTKTVRLCAECHGKVHDSKMVSISTLTKAALAAYKARGGKLGGQRPECKNLTEQARKLGAARAGVQASKAAMEAYADLVPVVCELRAGGLTLQGIADELNRQGHTTRRGRPWRRMQVSRVLALACPEVSDGQSRQWDRGAA